MWKVEISFEKMKFGHAIKQLLNRILMLTPYIATVLFGALTMINFKAISAITELKYKYFSDTLAKCFTMDASTHSASGMPSSSLPPASNLTTSLISTIDLSIAHGNPGKPSIYMSSELYDLKKTFFRATTSPTTTSISVLVRMCFLDFSVAMITLEIPKISWLYHDYL